jgi:hypothetical protein
MKLVIGGSSGFVGTELVRQALDNPAITSIVGISRRETPVPEGSVDNAGKLKSIVCDDFTRYPDSLKKELEDVDACIWLVPLSSPRILQSKATKRLTNHNRTIAITPSKILGKTVPWEDVVKVCHDYTLVALEAVASAPRQRDIPLRFVYISGHFAPRDGDPILESLTDFGLAQVASMRVRYNPTSCSIIRSLPPLHWSLLTSSLSSVGQT